MNKLLSPQEMAEIREQVDAWTTEFHFRPRKLQIGIEDVVLMLEKQRALLQHIDAIADELDRMAAHAKQYMPDLCDSVCRDDNRQRELGNHGDKGGSAFSAIKSVITGIEELLNDIRGNRG